jgi:hypothetical protein
VQQGGLAVSFGIYARQLLGIVTSSSLALGLIAGIALLVHGDFTMNLEGEFEFGRYDGLWLIFGLPVVSTLIFGVLSPLSFLISRLLSRKTGN